MYMILYELSHFAKSLVLNVLEVEKDVESLTNKIIKWSVWLRFIFSATDCKMLKDF